MDTQETHTLPSEPWLTTKALAARWHCSAGWLANQRCACEGPPYLKMGKRVLYRLSDIEAFECAHMIEPIA